MRIPGVKIVVIGGGTGSFTVLQGLKHYARDITALVNMADDGGSTGMLRDELGVLPPGDVRQCLVALSESPRARDLFNYRFEEGTLAGHAMGNLFMAALEKMTGSFAEAVEEASRVLNIVGKVEPITLDPVTLVLEKSDGSTLEHQFEIGHADFGGVTRPNLRLQPEPTLNPLAKKAIEQADLIVIAPGNLYGSLGPALIVPGMREAMQRATAKKVYICNLVTKPGQTDGFSVADFAHEIERLGGFELDYVVCNDTLPTAQLLEKYAKDGEKPVEFNKSALKKERFKVSHGALLSDEFVATNTSIADPIGATRTYIRHNPDKVCRMLMKIYFS